MALAYFPQARRVVRHPGWHPGEICRRISAGLYKFYGRAESPHLASYPWNDLLIVTLMRLLVSLQLMINLLSKVILIK